MISTNRLPVRAFLVLIALAAVSGWSLDAQQVPAATRDPTPGATWIDRLERPDRIPGLRLDDVIACLEIGPGDVVADIGAGTGAFSLPFAKAVAPSGRVLAQDLWPDLMDYIGEKAKREGVTNLETVLGTGDDPMLPAGQVDVVFFHDVFHNIIDREAYLRVLVGALTPTGRIAIIEQEFDDPIAEKWDIPENRITAAMVDAWMTNVGFRKVGEFDIFQGENNPPGTGMPERWFVVYAKGDR
jgi:SAM-dependent methyltransferase